MVRKINTIASVIAALIVGAGLMGWLLHTIASVVSGMPDPSYAFPAALRVGLALGHVDAMRQHARRRR